MRIARIILAAIVLLTASICGATFAMAQDTGAATPPADAPGTGSLAVGDSTSGAYVLGRDDVVAVGLLGRNDWGGRARVQADGTIQLPLVGKVVAADQTAAELGDTIRKKLQTGGYYADPIVNIEVVSYSSRYVVVLGAVGKPGLVPINRPYRLSEILARVGGVQPGAADYLVVRSADGTEKKPLISDLATGGPDKDPVVVAGDKIYAPIAEVYYVYGAVRSPGVYPLMGGDLTVKMALAKAGGVTENGSDKRVQVTREGKTISLDAAAKLQAKDVVFVKERMF
jgi:polysaccharide export outer membrane protein